jgi:hypothetical protein
LHAVYAVTPPHMMGPASSSVTPSGMRVVYFPSAMQYSYAIPTP